MPCSVHRARGLAGFSLIELLVVVAVLGLLAALLTPFLRKGKANLRSWGIGMLAYAAEHQGFLPHPDGHEREVRGTDKGEHGWMDVVPPYLEERPWRDYPDGRKPTRGIWQCPGARPIPGGHYNYSPERQGYFSYAMNSYLAHDFDFGLPWNVDPQAS